MKTTQSNSFSRLRALPLLATFGLTCALAYLPVAPVAHAQALPASVGVVDEEKLADGYKLYQTAIGDLDKRAQGLDAKIPAREYLNDTEGKAFDSIIVLDKLSPAQQTQLDGLVKTGNDRKAEFLGLIGNASRTPANNTRLKELQDMASKNGPDLQRLSQNLLEAIRKQQDDVDKSYTDKANSVVIQVANEKKLSAVIRKKALVWSADNIDITEEVLKRLN